MNPAAKAIMLNEKPGLDIAIVNWNSADQLRACLQSIEQADTCHFDVPKIIVDDIASADDSMTNLPFSLPLANITNELNRGFGTACNQGAVGICGIQLDDGSGQVAPSCAGFPSSARFILQGIGLSRLIPRAGLFILDWDHCDTRCLDHVIGAFRVIQRSLFTSLGGFTQRFFVYNEDLDLSYRVKTLAWPTLFLSGATAFHAGGGTSDQIKVARLFYSLRSRVQYAFKRFSIAGAVCVLLAALSGELLARCSIALVRKSISSFFETFCAYRMLIQGLPRWLFSDKIR